MCWEHHKLSREILEGTRQGDEWFAYVCGLDEADNWQDERVWPKANPSLPALPGARYLREQIAEAAAMPARQAIVQRLNLYKWTESSSVWIDMAAFRDICTRRSTWRRSRGSPSCSVRVRGGARG